MRPVIAGRQSDSHFAPPRHPDRVSRRARHITDQEETGRGIGLSLLFLAIAVSTDLWSIYQSRSSTAALGLFVVPLIGALAGFLGLRLRPAIERPPTVHRKSERGWRSRGAVVLVGFTCYSGPADEREESRQRRRAGGLVGRDLARSQADSRRAQ